MLAMLAALGKIVQHWPFPIPPYRAAKKQPPPSPGSIVDIKFCFPYHGKRILGNVGFFFCYSIHLLATHLVRIYW